MAFASISSAQVAGPAGGAPPLPAKAHHAKQPLVAALGQLDLSTTQKSKIDQILADRKADNKAFRKAHQGDLPALKDHRKTEEKTTMDGIHGVLTTDQWTKLTTILHQNKKKGKNKKGTVNPPAAPPTSK
jgi:hypothetical protein